MLKKILSTSLIILQIFTQSASALEFRPIIQPLQIQSDILKNENPLSVSDAFSFFNISDIFVNQPMVVDQGLSVYSKAIADQTLSNRSGWRLTGAYLRVLSKVKRPLVVFDSSGLLTIPWESMTDHRTKDVLRSVMVTGQRKVNKITGTRNVVFTYDGENRLLSVQPVTPVANNKRLEFVYDYQGRRVQKLVYNRSGSSWVLQLSLIHI